MDYIQHKLYRVIEKTKKRRDGKNSTIVGYYNVLTQYQLYLMFACVWDKRELELPRSKRMEYLEKMKRASLGTILNVIAELDSMGKPVLGVNKKFQELMSAFIKPRNSETAHGILIPGLQEESYQKLAEHYENIHRQIRSMGIPILSEDCRIYYMPSNENCQVTVFDNDDYDYQDFNEELVKALDIQPGELYYYFENNCYKLSPFLILKEITNREDPYEIYCYQRYNLKNGKFEYKRYSELSDNISYSKICKDYFLSFQEEYSHTICKANGVICNKFENNYDYFISTNPIDSHEQKVWNFLKKNRSNACLTIRGGGGIGKTALVQYICTKNIFEPFRMEEIQYVIFCSAKDREFKQIAGLTGHIKDVKNESTIRCYKDIIRIIAWVLDIDADYNMKQGIEHIENIFLQTPGILLIVDDFETLLEEDKEKVVSLSSRLDVTRHKMIITTRSQYMVGLEYYMDSLDQTQTITFMKERFKRSCTIEQYNQFERFVQNREIRKKIHELTKGLPMLIRQLGNLLLLNGFKESSLVKREDEEVEDFLLGRLYNYFGTVTSKLLFLIIAYFYQFGSDEMNLEDLKIIYMLYCMRLHIVDVDYDQDLNELQKLKIIKVETEYIRISNYISNSILRKCQEELIESEEIPRNLFDMTLFKKIMEFGVKEGILSYYETKEANIDYAFIKIFALENMVKLTNDIRFSILEKYILNRLDDVHSLTNLYSEACVYFDIPMVESKFVYCGKKYGFLIPELSDKRDIYVDEKEVSVDYYIQEVISELEEQLNAIDEFLMVRKKGASQSYCLEMKQAIRGKLGSICNVKLVKILSYDLTEYHSKLLKIKDLMDDISYTKEFNMKENEQYLQLQKYV